MINGISDPNLDRITLLKGSWTLGHFLGSYNLCLWKGKLGEQEEKQEEAESVPSPPLKKWSEDLRHISKEDIQVG